MAKNGRVVILGAGESGTGAAVLARRQGYDVFVSDAGPLKAPYRKRLQREGIPFEENRHTAEKILEAAEVVKSPGIPAGGELMERLAARGIPVVSEIEFAGRFTNARIVGITGTNGKTTTTLLTHHLLVRAGLNAGLAGNVGQSFALQVAEKDHDCYVLELSSFQLDGLFDFRAHVAVLLNITPDHLDRYNYSMAEYTESKFRITRNQTAADAFVYCADDPVTAAEVEKRRPAARLYPYGLAPGKDRAAWVSDDFLYIHTNQQNDLRMSIHDLALKGKHNLNNSMAAAITGRVFEISNEAIRACLSDFVNIEHRLERVNTVHGIEFINDSKATNVNAAWYALESMEKPVIWIAGGVDKGNDYSLLEALVREKVKAIVCLGKDNRKLHKAFAGIVNEIRDVESAADAVREAYRLGKKGDAVLLSPACASFDLFSSFEDRGRQFKEAVRAL
jgi:UDP-N-acetylmuramoylalanine--D-glutamate ligase